MTKVADATNTANGIGAAMTKHATGTFGIKDWEETTVSEIDGGGKLTHVSCINTFHGDIDGKAKAEYVLVYRSDGSGSYVGSEHVIGQIAGRSGSFVLQHSGTFKDGSVGSWVVVSGSGTGDLSGGLHGEGHYVWDGEGMTFTLDYEFDSPVDEWPLAAGQGPQEFSPFGGHR